MPLPHFVAALLSLSPAVPMDLSSRFRRSLVLLPLLAAGCSRSDAAPSADAAADSSRAAQSAAYPLGDSASTSAVVAGPVSDSATPAAAAPARESMAAPADTGAIEVTVRSGRTRRDSLALVRTVKMGREHAGWPVKGPAPLPGSILPNKRIVAYYGNPLSKRMGALGEYQVDDMLQRLDKEVVAWRAADPSLPVQPALHLVAVVAQGSAGRDGKWRTHMADTLVERVYSWAQRANAIMFVDVQVGLSTLQADLPRLEKFLMRPDVHLGIDPEFSMKGGQAPGKKIGTFDAADINYATKYLADLVEKHNLPPKVLVVHRFTRGMVTNSANIRLDPRVQIVMHMDGWGAPWLKFDSYRDYITKEPVQYAGFKLFYGNDTKAGDALLTPKELVQLSPRLLYIQYQ